MKRLNPKTGTHFKHGEIREDGFVFKRYNVLRIKKNGEFQEDWVSPKVFANRNIIQKLHRKTKRGHLSCTFQAAKKRAVSKNLDFNIDLEYLKNIAVDVCPVFGTLLNWGHNGNGLTQNSPSLDRIIPEKGYTKGNLRFVSNLANNMKQNATPEQLHQFADWVKETIPKP